MNTKHRLLTGCASWIDALAKTNNYSHFDRRLEEYGVDYSAELPKLTVKQLRMVQSLCAAVYNHAHEESRAWNRNYKADQIRWKQERLSKLGREHLKLVAGGR